MKYKKLFQNPIPSRIFQSGDESNASLNAYHALVWLSFFIGPQQSNWMLDGVLKWLLNRVMVGNVICKGRQE